MPSGITASDLIKTTLRKIGAIATGETPTTDELNDGLIDLNDIMEVWSTQNLAVYGTQDVTFNTVAGVAAYTIGPTGTWVSARPVRINQRAYCRVDGQDFPVTIWGQEDYDLLADKTQQQRIVSRLLYVNDNPDGRITLWPVPSDIIPITMSIDRVLANNLTLATVMNFPPGYLKCFQYHLGIELSADYQVDLPSTWISQFNRTFGALKRANKKKRTASIDEGLLRIGHGWNTEEF